VVYQGQYRNTGCQFTFTCDGSVRHKPYGGAWDRAKNVALHVMLGLNTPVTNNATHYQYRLCESVLRAEPGGDRIDRDAHLLSLPEDDQGNGRMRGWRWRRVTSMTKSIAAFEDVDGLEGVPPPAEIQPDGSLIAISLDAQTPVAIATKAPFPPVDDRPL